MDRWLPLLLLCPTLAFAAPDGPPVEVAPAGAVQAAPVAGDAPAPGGRPAKLADDPDAREALLAYNAGRYNEASRRFLALAQRWPQEAALYRALARARVWAGDAPEAVRAYRLYLVVAPEAEDRDKVEAELELAVRKAGGKTPKGEPPAEAAQILGMAAVRARSGAFVGTEGAFAAIDRALEAGYLGPGLTDVRAAVAQALVESSVAALERWWAPAARVETSTLEALGAAWAEQARRRPLTPAEASHPAALAGLLALAEGRGEDAAALLTPVAPTDFRLRYAQAVAFLQVGRFAEAEPLLEALARVDQDPRVLVLLGLVQRAGGKPDAVETLRAGLLGGE